MGLDDYFDVVVISGEFGVGKPEPSIFERTLALLLVVPIVLLTLMYFVYEGRPHTFQAIGAPMCGLFPLDGVI